MSHEDCNWKAVSFSSKKGFGPLASTTSRLSGKPCYTGPGPGSYSPQDNRTKHPQGAAGSAPFCTTGRGFSAPAWATSTGSGYPRPSSSSPGPGSHGIPSIAYTGTDLAWGSHHKPGAGAAFKAPSRSHTASAACIREQLQHQKHQGCQAIPWLLAPPKSTGGRPLPGPRLVQSARPHGASARALQDQPQQAAARAALAGRSLVQHGCQQPPQYGGDADCHSTAAHRHGDRSSWQVLPGSAAAPGPGSYDLLKYGALKADAQSHRSAFTKPLVLDRFGASALHHLTQQQATQHKQQAGQAHQCRPQQAAVCSSQAARGVAARPRGRACSPPSSRQPGVSAGFRSKSPGHAEAHLATTDADMLGAPGPTYYSPQAPPHRTSYRQAGSAHGFLGTV